MMVISFHIPRLRDIHAEHRWKVEYGEVERMDWQSDFEITVSSSAKAVDVLSTSQ
jgi:hypothetical protein